MIANYKSTLYYFRTHHTVPTSWCPLWEIGVLPHVHNKAINPGIVSHNAWCQENGVLCKKEASPLLLDAPGLCTLFEYHPCLVECGIIIKVAL